MEIIMHSPDDLAAAAEKFTAAMDGHKIFAFYGSMGAGKTTFIRAVCKALGNRRSYLAVVRNSKRIS